MRVLWASNAPWCATGYGQQTALFVPLIGQVYETAIAANFGIHGAPTTWQGHKVYPAGYDVYSNDIIPSHAADFLHGEPGDGWIVALFDAYALRNPRYQRFNMAVWAPVDHLPAPPGVVKFFFENNAVPIAMSRFGEAQFHNAGLDCLYVPHGIDTDEFTPGDQTEARRMLGLPTDAFVVTMNAANKGRDDRKSFFESFAGFAALARLKADAVLYMHTEQLGLGMGINLAQLAHAAGVPEDRIFWVDQYAYRMSLPPKVVAATYRASNVLLAPSKGEGFGIPVIEAQACGTKVIVSDFSAQPELVGEGWKVPGEPWYDHNQSAAMCKPSIEGIYGALCEAYDAPGPSDKAREHALGYDFRRVFDEHMLPVLRTLEERTPHLTPITKPTLSRVP